MSKLIVHHLEKSRSHRILWLLEELGVEYDLKMYKRDPETIRAPQELRDIHPLGKSPVVSLDGLVLAESGAIIEHLVEKFESPLLPERGTESFLNYRYFLHYAEGSLMPPLLVRLIFNRLKEAPLPFFLKPIIKAIVSKVDKAYTNPEIRNHLSFLEETLGKQEYIAGDSFTAADIQMSYPIEAALTRGAGEDKYPNLHRWCALMKERPAYQKALEVGGPNSF